MKQTFTKQILCCLFGTFALLPNMVKAQTPLTNCGTDITGTYTNYTSTAFGAFKQVRVQETNSTSSGTRKWEWNSDSYFNTWRAPSTGYTISGYNQAIVPNSGTASAYWRNNYGGSGGMLPATTSGNYSPLT